MKRATLLLAFTIAGAFAADLSGREWTSANGKFKVEAELVEVKDGSAFLKLPDGSLVSVQLEKLCEKDREFIASEAGDGTPTSTEDTESAEDPVAEPGRVVLARLKGEKADDPPGEARRFTDIGWGIRSLAFSPDGGFLAAGKMDEALLLFDVSASSRAAFVKDLRLLGQVSACAFTPDGKQLLTGGFHGLIEIWDVSRGGELRPAAQFVGHSQEVTCISVSADGKFALSGGQEKTVRYWQIEGSTEVANFSGFEGTVKACQISRDGRSALATDGHKLLTINLKTEAVKTSELNRSWASGQFAAFSPDGRLVAAGDTYNVRLWELASGRELPTLTEREIQWSGAFTPDGTRLITGGRGKVIVWDVKSQKRIGVLATEGSGYIQTVATSPDNRHIAAIPSSAGQSLQVFRIQKE